MSTRTISDEVARELAQRLDTARSTLKPCAPLTADYPELTMDDAYAVQTEVLQLLLADSGVNAGEEIVGYKLGLTSKPMQQLLGVDSPDFAPVLSGHVHIDSDGSGVSIDLSTMIQPKLEAEIALVLGDDLSGPDCTAEDVAKAVSHGVAALEIVDSRVADWKIKLADTISDMASSGAIALSPRGVALDDIDPSLIGMVFHQNGEVTATGAGAAALGHPYNAVAWLVNVLHPLGVGLKAGHILMTGALHAAVPISAGDEFTAEFDRLGPITLRAR